MVTVRKPLVMEPCAYMMKLAQYATDRVEPRHASRRHYCQTKRRRARTPPGGSGRALPVRFNARDEARADSDVDVFVDPESDERFGFLQYMDAYQTIRDAIGTDVEIGYSTREGLSRYVRAGIEREAIRVF